MAKSDDMLLVEGVEALDEYIADHDVASTKLKQGFLKLTKARLRLPPHALSEISYREEFGAHKVVSIAADGSWRLRDAVEAPPEQQEESPLRHRKADKSKETNIINKDPNAETLLWFSSLPPSDLRQAQKQFASGLQALLTAAASARKTQIAVDKAIKAAP